MKTPEFEMEVFGEDMDYIDTVLPTKIIDEKNGKFCVEFPETCGRYFQVRVKVENKIVWKPTNDSTISMKGKHEN